MNRGIIWLVVLVLTMIGFSSCQNKQSGITSEVWGDIDGKTVSLITMTNQEGMLVKITNYGGTITDISVPDKNGNFESVVIGYDSLMKYREDRMQHGKTIGRYANRIGGAQFTLNNQTYKLTANNGDNTLHGGENGFSKQVFNIDTVYTNKDSSVVSLHYFSPDLEEGFPGNLTLYLDFILTGDNELILDYKAVTDKPTVVNFTNHSYFNLSGTGEEVWDHKLKIVADSITPVINGLPTGNLVPVDGTMYDFREECKIIERKDSDAWGYDINYKLSKNSTEPALAAVLKDTVKGRVLEAYTTEPGMQLFSMGNAVCLEMQHFPDSPNHPQFPSVVLNPGEVYRQITIYRFTTAASY